MLTTREEDDGEGGSVCVCVREKKSRRIENLQAVKYIYRGEQTVPYHYSV